MHGLLLAAILHFAPLAPVPGMQTVIVTPLQEREPDSRKCTSSEKRLCMQECNDIGQAPTSCSVGTDPATGRMTQTCKCWEPQMVASIPGDACGS